MFKGSIDLDAGMRGQAGPVPGDPPPGVDIVTLRHPMVERFQWVAGHLVILLCRERCSQGGPLQAPPGAEEGERAVAFCEAHARWPLDHQYIVVDLLERSVRFGAGHGGVAPLYVHVAGARLTMSWSIADLYGLVDLADVKLDLAALLLLGTLPYAATTLFGSIHMVTERAVLRVTPLAVTVQYPPPAPYYVPTALRGDADVVGAEFSGGLDSAIIAAVLAQGQAEPLPTYALHVQGPARDQQKARRALAVAHFGFDDYLLDVGCAPAIPAGFDGERAYDAAPYNADLQQSLRPLLRHFGQRTGVRAVATGTGGDEVLMAHAFEQDAAALAQNLNDAFLPVAIPDSLTGISRERLADYAATCDRAPFPVLPISVLEAAAARAPLFMAHGMWLVSPFAQPEAVRFYRCLPQHVRAQKSLHRAMLRRLGYPEPFLYVPERENFVPYLRQSLVDGAPAIAAALRRQCLMHEMGLVDGDRFIRMVEAVTPRSSLDDVGFLLHGFNLEWMLRRVGRRGLSAPVTGHAA